MPGQRQQTKNHPAVRHDLQWLRETGLYCVLLLFFFQLLSTFIDATYAFGLLGTSFPVEAVSILLLFTPVLWLVLPRRNMHVSFSILVLLTLLCRTAEVFLDTRGKMIVAGLGVGSFLLLFPLLLQQHDAKSAARRGYLLGAGLAAAVLLHILFRALYSGSDITNFGFYRLINLVFALAAGLLLWSGWRSTLWIPIEKKAGSHNSKAKTSPGGLKVFFLIIGLFSVWLLFYFAFASPNVFSGWTGIDYLAVLGVLLASFSIFLFVYLRPGSLETLSPQNVLFWNLVFVIVLVLAIFAHQAVFPLSPESYPMDEPITSWWWTTTLFAALFLSPVLLLDFMFFVRETAAAQVSIRRLGGWFSLGSLFLLLSIFTHIFTTVYDYIPVVGPLFRDRFWLVHLLPGLGLCIPFFFRFKGTWKNAKLPSRLPVLLGAGAVIVSAAALVGAFFARPLPAEAAPKDSLRVLTYNIQQGYNAAGLKDLAGQLEVMVSANADIIALQESDGNRIANGNTDLVRYFADRLDMYWYTGPKTITGTFGIALLSRYPIEDAQTFYMFSEGEQTASILAKVTVGAQTVNILVTHLGNDGPLVQQQAVLERLQGLENVIAVGDFNFRPDTEQYGLTTQLLGDAWLLTDEPQKETQGIDPSKRIDHTFITSDLQVLSSQYIPSAASDHPAMLSEIGW